MCNSCSVQYIRKISLETRMSEDLAVDVGLTLDSAEFKKFVDQVDSILEYGCTSVTRVVQDIVDKCHTSELDIARQVIRACVSPTSNKRPNKLNWWETYQTTVSSTRRPRVQQRRRHPPRDQQQRRHPPRDQQPRDQQQCRRPREQQRRRPREQQRHSKRRRSMSPLFQRPKRSRSPNNHRCLSPRSVQTDRPHPYDQNRSHQRRPMQLSFDRENSGRSRGTHDRYYDDNPRDEEKRKRPTSPLFDPDSDVPTWPRSKRRRQY